MAPLSQLHTLDLARNHLSCLGPRPISSSSLCYLDLSHNQLTSLTQLQHLPHLRELLVSDNQLQSLGTLAGCPLLLVLAAQHNEIRDFPAVLNCVLLRMLNLSGNRWQLPPRHTAALSDACVSVPIGSRWQPVQLMHALLYTHASYVLIDIAAFS